MVNLSTKVIIVTTCIAAMMAAAYLQSGMTTTPTPASAEVVEEYVRWQLKFKPTLRSTPSEQDFRIKVFAANRALVKNRNEEYAERVVAEDLPEYEGDMFELNFSADLTSEEFDASFTGGSLPTAEEEEVSPAENVQASVDESKSLGDGNLGAAHSYYVYSQGGCGSCWAFASAGLAERKYFSVTNMRVQLSQQQLVDCDGSNSGCSGGIIGRGLTYINNNGVTTASSYPYTGAVGNCKSSGKQMQLRSLMGSSTYTFEIRGVESFINRGNYAGGRVNGQAVRFASSGDGIFTPSQSDCVNHVNHAIILIEASTSQSYVTMLNSWGGSWGNNGVKKIRPCGANNYAGSGAQYYTY